MFARWREQTPDGFVFSLKAPRYATHRKSLATAGPTIERFLNAVVHLKEKLGPINWQLPPEKSFDPFDFGAFLKLLPARWEDLALRHAIEVRHDSFLNAECVQLARQQGVALVIAADGPWPQITDITAPFVYARLMGTRPGEPAGYPEAALQAWAERARAWAAGVAPNGLAPALAPAPGTAARDVFIYFINAYKVSNPAAAQALLQRLESPDEP